MYLPCTRSINIGIFVGLKYQAKEVDKLRRGDAFHEGKPRGTQMWFVLHVLIHAVRYLVEHILLHKSVQPLFPLS